MLVLFNSPAQTELVSCARSMHRTRANLVQSGQKKPSHVGCNGWCAIPRRLHYIDYSTIFVLPVAHMLLLGLVKGFWKLLLQTIPRGEQRPAYVINGKTRRVMSQRAKEVVYTADYGGPPRCVPSDSLCCLLLSCVLNRR